MGRSVSYPSGAVVAFSHWENDEPEMGSFWFDEEVLMPFADQIARMFPSAYKVDEWLGREDHAIMANRHAYFGVSEYGGLIAYWVKPRGDSEVPELAENWVAQIADKFSENFASLRSLGVMSNGERVLERISA